MAVGTRQGLADQGRIRSAQKHASGSTRRASNWSSTAKRVPASVRSKSTAPPAPSTCFRSPARPQAQHPARAQRAQPRSQDRADQAEQADYIDHPGSYEPKPRLKDMDMQGIDQVMIIPTDIDTYPGSPIRSVRRRCARPTTTGPMSIARKIPSACTSPRCCRCRIPCLPSKEVYRVAAKGCRVGLVRPIDAMGNYPIQPKYDARVACDGGNRRRVRHASVPGSRLLKPPGYTEQYSGAELIGLTASSAGLPHSFLINVQDFQAEASLWVTMVLMSGFFERYTKLRLRSSRPPRPG